MWVCKRFYGWLMWMLSFWVFWTLSLYPAAVAMGPKPIDPWASPGSYDSIPLKVSLFKSELFLIIAPLFFLMLACFKSSLMLFYFFIYSTFPVYLLFLSSGRPEALISMLPVSFFSFWKTLMFEFPSSILDMFDGIPIGTPLLFFIWSGVMLPLVKMLLTSCP